MRNDEAGAAAARAAAGSLRQSLVDYVRAVHEAYLSTAGERGAELDALPLAGPAFTVAVVAAGQLHVLATRDALPALRPHEQPVDDELGPLHWQVRFLDATVLADLAFAGGPDGDDVPGLLGVTDVLYHLLVQPDASLDAHQAIHAGAGLAGAHVPGGHPLRPPGLA